MAKASTRARRGKKDVLPDPAATTTRTRASKTCSKCPDTPLLSQCIHSKAGKAYLSALKSKADDQPSTPKSARRCHRCPGHPLQKQCIHTEAGRTYLMQQEVLQDLSDTTRNAHVPGTATTSVSATARNAGLPLSHQVEASPSQSAYQPETPTRQVSRRTLATPIRSATRRYVITPNLPSLHTSSQGPSNPPLELPGATPPVITSNSSAFPHMTQGPSNPLVGPSGPTQPETQDQEISLPPGQQDTPTTTQGTTAHSTSRPPNASRVVVDYNRATKSNKIYGVVEGCMRGDTPHSVVRQHARPTLLEDGPKASRRFLDSVNRLFERADDLAARTGCWLFIGAQHAGGRRSTLHYTSPRLARDAPKHILHIVNEFSDLIDCLQASRRSNAVDMGMDVLASRREHERLMQEQEALKKTIGTLQHEVQQRDEMLRMYSSGNNGL